MLNFSALIVQCGVSVNFFPNQTQVLEENNASYHQLVEKSSITRTHTTQQYFLRNPTEVFQFSRAANVLMSLSEELKY